VDGKTYQGWKYYSMNCARCHGEDVLGTTLAPHLILSLKPDGTVPDEGVFLQVACGGRPEKGMPAWCTMGLTTAQLDTIYAYVKGRSEAKLHPGRPARRE
jgi:mono/diheme cytochrome c family protein